MTIATTTELICFLVLSAIVVIGALGVVLLSNIVYQYKCRQCDSTYVGESIRHFATRIAEHKGVSVRTGLRLSNPGHSNIREHSVDNQHAFSDENFKVLRVSNRHDIKLCESIFLHKLEPT